MTKNKNMPFDQLKVKAESYNKKEFIELNSENGEGLTYFSKFSKTKIDGLFVDLIEQIQYATTTNNSAFENPLFIPQYIKLLIIKHFSTAKEYLQDQSVETHIETYKMFYDIGLLDYLIEDIFDKEEVEKVMTQYDKICANGKLLLAEQEKYKKQADKELKVLNKKVK